MLDEDAVFEDRDLHAIIELTHGHHSLDSLSPSQELRLGQDRGATPTCLTAVSPALALGLQTSRALDARNVPCARFAHPYDGVRGIIGLGTGFLTAPAPAPAPARRAGLVTLTGVRLGSLCRGGLSRLLIILTPFGGTSIAGRFGSAASTTPAATATG